MKQIKTKPSKAKRIRRRVAELPNALIERLHQAFTESAPWEVAEL